MRAKDPDVETIRCVFRNSSLGTVLIAMSDSGVCALLMGDDEEILANDLRRRFRNAKLSFQKSVDPLSDAVLALIDAPTAPVTFPIDLRGTPFQERVWAALREIPGGQTATYADIARAIGAPTATRAVAGACGANPLAVAIPCHRVLRSDGTLSGYRWGVDKKRALLAREGVDTP